MQTDPLWYKDAVIYETHVRAFCDTIGDGVGDFRGLTTKLDYLRDLGVTAIWILPFYPSPLRDDGYDIADYTSVHPQYGTIESFQEFLDAAHQRGLRVITELVINHTSDQHPWFQRARMAPKGSPERNFYVWSDAPDKYLDARIIFKDTEPSNWTYDNVAGQYYWHRFFSHQPDLNFDNPEVCDAIFPLLDFWMDLGVDAMRLDAVPYLIEREGTNCENLSETHAYLKRLRAHVDQKYPGRMLLAEANQWPEDAVAYFGDGDECHMAFHFPVMPRLFMAIHREDRFPIVDIMDQTPAIPENCQWAMFLRNHDELTLEMVTDEERDHMYRAYAYDTRARINLGIRRRLAPLLGNDRRKIELMNGLLFSLPGTPVMYYGDEIGMGDNIYLGDRNGVRTPMQWSADRNAGFSRANPQKLYLPIVIDPEYHYETINVDAQQNNPNSLLWWTKRLIELRKRHKAFSRGTLDFLHPDNRKVLAFVRSFGDEHILIVANLSRFVQYAKLDLSQYQGAVPIELFGSTPFPRIGRLPYLLTLSPHTFYWFSLTPHKVSGRAVEAPAQGDKAVITSSGSWDSVFMHHVAQLEAALPDYVQRSSWYDEWPKSIKAAKIRESFRIEGEKSPAFVLIVDVDFRSGDTGTYAVPLAWATGAKATDALELSPESVLCQIRTIDATGVLRDAMLDPNFHAALVNVASSNGRLRGNAGSVLAAVKTDNFEGTCANVPAPMPADVADPAPQRFGAVCDGGRLLLSFQYRLDEGIQPAWEIGRFLATRGEGLPIAPVAGTIEYRPRNTEANSLALLHCNVRHDTDAWTMTLDTLGDFCERVLALSEEPAAPDVWPQEDTHAIPQAVDDLLGDYLDHIGVLGRRVAELHLALASDSKSLAFKPEGFSSLNHRSAYQTMRTLKMGAFDELKRRLVRQPAAVQRLGDAVLEHDGDVMRVFRRFLDQRVEALRIRVHGDLHLGSILWTGTDFVVVNFRGAPLRASVSERRLKRSPLWDIASLVRSLHYATQYVLFGHGKEAPNSITLVRRDDRQRLKPWLRFWYQWVSHQLVSTYNQTADGAAFLPATSAASKAVLDAYLMERALRELRHELQSRSSRVAVPLAGILDLLGVEEPQPEPAVPAIGENGSAASSATPSESPA
jgi:maltose alpha-D-glucosyltransferase/alpha-amylase